MSETFLRLYVNNRFFFVINWIKVFKLCFFEQSHKDNFNHLIKTSVL